MFHEDVEFQFCYHNTFFVIIRLFLTLAKVRMLFIVLFVVSPMLLARNLIEFIQDGGSDVCYRAGLFFYGFGS